MRRLEGGLTLLDERREDAVDDEGGDWQARRSWALNATSEDEHTSDVMARSRQRVC